MTPTQFEESVCEYYRREGYDAKLTPSTGDYGVDIFATKKKQKLAIQVKMYGRSARKINRQAVMELHGAKDYFDCTDAVIATDGEVLPDALEVASKLNIEILYLRGNSIAAPKRDNGKGIMSFDRIWERYIMPLQGKTLMKSDGESNVITKVDWSGVERLTSNGKKGKIKIEIFKYAVNRLLTERYITRDEINQNYTGRASSGIILILSQVPLFTLTKNPAGLIYSNI